jgi:hypothetical protein
LKVEAPCCEIGRRDACTTIRTTVPPADEYGTRPAIAFGADDLGARELEVLAEEGGEGDEGGGPADLEAAAVDVEEDVVSHDFAMRADVPGVMRWLGGL